MVKTIFEACTPREEVLRGELREDLFAARLHDVIEGTADPIYQDPYRFLSNTYPTSGLELLLKQALGRLTGVQPSNSPIIRLETSFGGGKTHNLIALYHLATSEKDLTQCAEHIIDSKFIPEKPIDNVAGIVGTDLDVVNGVHHGDLTTYTPWGEIAYQLKGNAGYSLMKESDKQRVAPGTQRWEDIIGDESAIIMIDELAHYLRTAKGLSEDSTPGETTLAQQTVPFLMSLMEFASSRENVILVYTLTEKSDAYSNETEEINRELSEARKASARQEQVITPAEETEISSIVTHRLFKDTDRDNGNVVAEKYVEFYRNISGKVNLPPKATRSEYTEDIEQSYPFHPELIQTLNRKTATIPNFQRTRGALRLLANVVRKLWNEKPEETYLIHPYHMDLSVTQIVEELTSRLERPRFKSVIESDIYNPTEADDAHAKEIDKDFVSEDYPPYATQATTTIFLNSLTHEIATGVSEEELNISVLKPEDDPGLLERALREFEKIAWYLDYDGVRYKFKTEPSLNKIIEDEMESLGRTRAKRILNDIIEDIWPSSIFKVDYFPQEPADVYDDGDRPHLCIIHYDATTVKADQKEVPDIIERIFNRSGSSEGFRNYKNHLIFLAADKDRVDRMIELAQKFLAIRIIREDRDRLNELSEAQQDNLEEKYKKSRLNMKIAITKCYRYLYYPNSISGQDKVNLRRDTLPVKEQGEVSNDQSSVILNYLKNMEKVLDSESDPLSPQFVEAKAWPQNQGYISSEELRKAFARKESLKIILDINQLKETIRTAIENGVWVYYDKDIGVGYDEKSPNLPMIKISDDIILYTPEAAEEEEIDIERDEDDKPHVEYCPDCGSPVDDCICDGDISPVTEPLEAEGVPNQAFQSLLDICHDQKVKMMSQISLIIRGRGANIAEDVKRLSLAVPQISREEFFLKVNVVAEFEQNELFNLEFEGSWDRYTKIKQIVNNFSEEAQDVKIDMMLEIKYKDGLEVGSENLEDLRDIFTDLGLGAIELKAERGQ